MAWGHIKAAKLCHDPQCALLRHDEHFPIRILESARIHAGSSGIKVDPNPIRRWIAVAAISHQPIDKVDSTIGHRQRVPAQAVGCCLTIVWLHQMFRAIIWCIWAMFSSRAHAIEPAATVLSPWRSKGAGAKLFSVKSEGRALRAVASLRQRTIHGFGREVVEKSGLIVHLQLVSHETCWCHASLGPVSQWS